MNSVSSRSSVLEKKVSFALFFALAANVIFWFSLRDMQAKWGNVPPAPKEHFAAFYGLGDEAFAYRINGLMLQNMGDTGGRVTALKDYDYDTLTDWFYLQDKLDPVSDYIPFLASFYFSGTQDPEKFRPVLSYLEMVGVRTEGIKWKWLVQGVFFARHKLKDLNRALELANVLAKAENPDIPHMFRNLPALVLNEKGDSREAYGLLVSTLKANLDKMSSEDINATRAAICDQILTPEEAKSDPLCEGL
jgi:hypothetical protein